MHGSECTVSRARPSDDRCTIVELHVRRDAEAVSVLLGRRLEPVALNLGDRNDAGERGETNACAGGGDVGRRVELLGQRNT
jgi:hypothetical protein